MDIGIFAIAFGSNWQRYDSWHEPPELKDYIESFSPDHVLAGYLRHGKYYRIETGAMSEVGKVTAASKVVLPTEEARSFSFWLTQRHPGGQIEKSPGRTLEIFPNENGIIGLYFGVNRFPIYWPGFNINELDHWMHELMSYVPSWEPPHRQP